MGMNVRGFLGRVAYGLLFVAAVPAALWVWARAAAPNVPLPAVHLPVLGSVVAGLGGLLVAAAMLALAVEGGGLPMNAFPPPRLARGAPYAWLSHPIYVGYVALCAGVALALPSAAGLWLVAPAVALALTALVLGHERPDLRRRLPESALARPWLSLPPADDAAPTFSERLGVLVLVLGPWLVSYEALCRLGLGAGSWSSFLPFERAWPVLEWAEVPYASAYLLAPLAVLVAPRRAALRRFAVAGLVGTGLILFLFVVLPLAAPPRPFKPSTAPGRLLAWERAWDSPAAAFPSFHVFWAWLAAELLAARSRGWRLAAWSWAGAISLACLATGMHSLADVAGGVLACALLRRPDRLGRAALGLAERLANSWREWRFGKVRVISHALYAGLAGGTGMLVAGTLAGREHLGSAVAVALCGLLGAGVWAQLVEGSSVLLRPFGYYGAVVGVALAVPAVGLLGGDAWLVAAAYAVAAPFVQALGRLRCLVQGCCHGRPTTGELGIRHTHPRSRVTRLAGLAGVPIHPTAVYSIAGNLVIGPLLVRLFLAGAALSLVAGLYLLLSGIARFAEEAYRGEPQTRIVLGLRLYQWLAVASAVAGAVLTSIPTAGAPGVSGLVQPALWGIAVLFGLVTAFAMGVDFPDSSRRFSRLV